MYRWPFVSYMNALATEVKAFERCRLLKTAPEANSGFIQVLNNGKGFRHNHLARWWVQSICLRPRKARVSGLWNIIIILLFVRIEQPCYYFFFFFDRGFHSQHTLPDIGSRTSEQKSRSLTTSILGFRERFWYAVNRAEREGDIKGCINGEIGYLVRLCVVQTSLSYVPTMRLLQELTIDWVKYFLSRNRHCYNSRVDTNRHECSRSD